MQAASDDEEVSASAIFSAQQAATASESFSRTELRALQPLVQVRPRERSAKIELKIKKTCFEN